MGRVDGKVALISGGARGMGASHARRLLEEGAKVVIADVLDEDGAALAKELGEGARYIHLDVTEENDWAAAVALAVNTFGGLDVLVNNAGILKAGPIDEYDASDWYPVIAVNLTGTFLGMKAAIPALKKSEHASIVNISSTGGLHGYAGLPAYTASKWGVRGLTKSAAIDLGQHGIRVNSVHPGVIETKMTEGLDRSQTLVALHRTGQPSEVSNLVLYLASDESSFSTGSEFVVDGGSTAGIAQPI